MKELLAIYRKALVAAGAAVGVATPLAVDGHISLAEGLAIAAAVLGALGVAKATNASGGN